MSGANPSPVRLAHQHDRCEDLAVNASGDHWYRRRRKRRTPRAHSPLQDTHLEALDECIGQQAEQRHATSRHGLARSQPIGLSHIAFLLAGAVIGAGFYALGGLLVRVGGYDRPAAPEPQPAPASAQLPATPPPPQVHPVTSTDPAVIVKAMLQASYAGRRDEAYAYWGLRPDERAFFGPGGMYATLAEMTRQAAAAGSRADLTRFSFEVRKKSREAATVGQLRHNVLVREYALTRHGNTWKIMACTEP